LIPSTFDREAVEASQKMNRPTLLTVSRHEHVAAALHQYVEIFLQNEEFTHKVERLTFACPAELFDKLDDYAPKQLRDMIALVDVGAEGESAWSVQDMWSDNGVAARLVLSYPEVYFVFFDMVGNPHLPELRGTPWDREVAHRHHFVSGQQLIETLLLIRLHARGFRTIFDPTGMRAGFKKDLLVAVDYEAPKAYAPLSESRINHAAVAADEEAAFVYLNGYVAYQAGFRVWLLTTEAEFRRVIGAGRCLAPDFHPNSLKTAVPPALSGPIGPANFGAVLADWDLAYPDHKGSNSPQSLLEYEDTQIQEVERLIVITGVENEKQLELCTKHGGFRAPKPFGGLFDLLTMDRDKNILWDRYDDAWKGIIKIQRESWIDRTRTRARQLFSRLWLESLLIMRFKPKTSAPARSTNHSAPYARSVVAGRLLSRAKLIGTVEPTGTASWVQMALLAAEAKEVLSGMSRTTAYEALALQNEAEVNAEVSFLGMSVDIDVLSRLDKLMKEGELVQRVGRTAKHERSKEPEIAQLNFLLQTTKNLRLRFSAYEQMDAAEECLRHFSRYQFRLIPWRSRWIFHKLAKGYVDRATRSGTSIVRLLGFSLLWIMVFSLAYTALLLAHPLQVEVNPTNSREFLPSSFAPHESPNRSPAVRNDAKSREAPDSSIAGALELAVSHSVFTFLELQPGISDVDPLKSQQDFRDPGKGRRWMRMYRSIMLSELAIAYLHLGLLVSVVYRRVTMRSP
jgi:hypothetical protein